MDGANWMFDADDTVVELWGQGDDILWAEGEACLIAGGQGLGKSTLAGQLIRAQLGLQDRVLGLPVTRVNRPILLLAMDRPRQLRRSMRRQFSEEERAAISGRLLIRPGPPIMDMAVDPTLLLRMAEAAGAGVVYVDSLKDAAVGLSTDEVGAMYNRARQSVLAAGINLCELHHIKKPSNDGSGGGISEVYGSTWLTSGAGSVIMLSGEPGDLEVRFRHVKSPANEVGPWKIHLDPDKGAFSVRQIDLLVSVKNAGADGLTAEDAAMDIYECRRPTSSEKKKAERKLDAMVARGLLVKQQGLHVPTWFLAENRVTDRPLASGMF
ncbi:AAA family ATPase [Mycolicibacterium septicum]|nr:AAA family ATPase [Mycolicibacterium septicum]